MELRGKFGGFSRFGPNFGALDCSAILVVDSVFKERFTVALGRFCRDRIYPSQGTLSQSSDGLSVTGITSVGDEKVRWGDGWPYLDYMLVIAYSGWPKPEIDLVKRRFAQVVELEAGQKESR